jgi:hypothetical protein
MHIFLASLLLQGGSSQLISSIFEAYLEICQQHHREAVKDVHDCQGEDEDVDLVQCLYSDKRSPALQRQEGTIN